MSKIKKSSIKIAKKKKTKAMTKNTIRVANQGIRRFQKIINKAKLSPNVAELNLKEIPVTCLEPQVIADTIWNVADDVVEFCVDTLFRAESFTDELRSTLCTLEKAVGILYYNANKLYGRKNKRNAYGEQIDFDLLTRIGLLK